MELTHFGHAALRIVSDGTTILVDPFITQNPFLNHADELVETLAADFIIVTHPHADHVGDTLAIAQRTGATIVVLADTHYEFLATNDLPVIAPNFGGEVQLTPTIKIKFYPAWHAVTTDGHASMSAGFALTIEGKLLYFAGDTGLYYDLKLVALRQPVDMAFLPIGGYYTMTQDDALIAASFLTAAHVLPIHYDTFPKIKADVTRFIADLPDGVGFKPAIGQPFNF